jgi:NTE family protein
MTEAADLVVGTSAGATTAAQVRSGIPAAELLASVLSAPARPAGQSRERPPSLPMATVFERMRAIGPEWPDRPMIVTALDAQTGELTAIDRDSGVDLVDAVTASTALPGLAPTDQAVVTITKYTGQNPGSDPRDVPLSRP